MSKAGVVNIHGKEYLTVAHRINTLREKHPTHSVVTELISADDERVVMKAAILDGSTVLATGYAEEVRASSNINRTSAVENCETSAVGRALAFLGLAGTEIASADEVANAISAQEVAKIQKQQGEHMEAVREHWESVVFIKSYLMENELAAALEAWRELGHEVMRSLWRAPSKGGVFTTLERKLLDQASENEATARREASE